MHIISIKSWTIQIATTKNKLL